VSRWVIIGDGAWGRGLARQIAANGHDALLVGERRIGARVPKNVEHSIDLAAALAETERVMLAVPVDRIERLLTDAEPYLRGDHRVVTAIRGLTPRTHLRPGEAIFQLTPVRQVAVLAGAADAQALKRKNPSALVVGTAFPAWAEEIQSALISSSLRIYSNVDPVGTELASVIATVLAVGLGVGRALGGGPATEATALTRSLAEMERVVRGLGGQANTAYGLAGLGLLAELAFEGNGTAFRAGAALASGDLETARDAAEVRAAARALAARTARHHLRSPMIRAVDSIFDGHVKASEAMRRLMVGSARAE